MKKFLLPAAALAVCFGSTVAFAQSETEKDNDHDVVAGRLDADDHRHTKSDDGGYTQYRRTITTNKHYDAGAFTAPSGYTYSRYAIGGHVPDALRGDDGLVLTGYGDYALQAPPHGLTWIRVGSDALLVDRKTGEVVETDYGLFKS